MDEDNVTDLADQTVQVILAESDHSYVAQEIHDRCSDEIPELVEDDNMQAKHPAVSVEHIEDGLNHGDIVTELVAQSGLGVDGVHVYMPILKTGNRYSTVTDMTDEKLMNVTPDKQIVCFNTDPDALGIQNVSVPQGIMVAPSSISEMVLTPVSLSGSSQQLTLVALPAEISTNTTQQELVINTSAKSEERSEHEYTIPGATLSNDPNSFTCTLSQPVTIGSTVQQFSPDILEIIQQAILQQQQQALQHQQKLQLQEVTVVSKSKANKSKPAIMDTADDAAPAKPEPRKTNTIQVLAHRCEACNVWYTFRVPPGEAADNENTVHFCPSCSERAANGVLELVIDPLQKPPEIAKPEKDKKKKKVGSTVVKNAKKEFVCAFCSSTFRSTKILQVHTLKLHTHDQCFLAKCGYCSASFESREKLREHIKLHKETDLVESADRAYRCGECGKVFAQEAYLHIHMKSHTEIKKYMCSECGKGFSKHGALTKHIRIHSGERPFSCHLCGKSFTHRSTLQEHGVVHIPEQDKQFSCTECKRLFASKKLLKRHLRIHRGYRPFTCTICSKTFTRHINMELHMRTHRGEKAYMCGICGKRFVHKSSVPKHMKSHDIHQLKMEDVEETLITETIPIPNDIVTNDPIATLISS